MEAELAPQTRPRSNTLPKSFGSTLEQVAHDGGSERRVTREETLQLIQRRVRDKREEDRWPEDVRVSSMVKGTTIGVHVSPAFTETLNLFRLIENEQGAAVL